MERGRYKYFPVVQNTEKAVFRHTFVYLNQREWTDQNSIYQAAQCKSLTPNGNQMYVVDTESEHADKKLAMMNRMVKKGIHPIIGPFDSVEEAIVAERKLRPLNDAEKLARADVVMADNAKLREENAELKGRGNAVGGALATETPRKDAANRQQAANR